MKAYILIAGYHDHPQLAVVRAYVTESRRQEDVELLEAAGSHASRVETYDLGVIGTVNGAIHIPPERIEEVRKAFSGPWPNAVIEPYDDAEPVSDKHKTGVNWLVWANGAWHTAKWIAHVSGTGGGYWWTDTPRIDKAEGTALLSEDVGWVRPCPPDPRP